MSINVVSLTGNITRDAELRNTASSNTAVLNFSIAVNDRRRNSATGNWEDNTNFIDVSVYGKRALSIANWCKKGTKVAIAGSLRQSTWKDKNTQRNRSRIVVVVDEIDFMQRLPSGPGSSTVSFDEGEAELGALDDR